MGYYEKLTKEEISYMPTEKLFDIALQYKKTKLWKQLCDTELFALKLSNGKIDYCSVMGELGEHIALALYVGRDGLDSYRKMFGAKDAYNAMAQRETMLSQNCVQCSFENKDELSPFEIEEAQRYSRTHGITYRGRKAFPQFRRYRPSHYPWYLKDETDEQLLYEALSAALEVAEKLKTTSKSSLGFLDGAPYDRVIPLLERSNDSYQLSTIELPDKQERIYPSPIVNDELLVDKLKKKKKTGLMWACEVVMFPSPMSDEAADDDGMVEDPENAPVFPFMLLIVDCKSGMVIPNELVADYDQDAEKLVVALAHSMGDHGVPSEIQVRDKRTEILLSEFAKQVDTKVLLHDDLPLLDEIGEDMIVHFCDDQDQNEEEMEEFLKTFMEMDDETLQSMPYELRKQMLELESQGVLPEPVSARVRRLFK